MLLLFKPCGLGPGRAHLERAGKAAAAHLGEEQDSSLSTPASPLERNSSSPSGLTHETGSD